MFTEERSGSFGVRTVCGIDCPPALDQMYDDRTVHNHTASKEWYQYHDQVPSCKSCRASCEMKS